MKLTKAQVEAFVTPAYKVHKIDRLMRDGKRYLVKDVIWTIAHRWLDTQNRRHTRFVADVFNEADAQLIANLLNASPFANEP
jgi:hypothetical protein